MWERSRALILQGSSLISGAALNRNSQTQYLSEGTYIAGGACGSSLLIYALQSINFRNKQLMLSACRETLPKAELVMVFLVCLLASLDDAHMLLFQFLT